MFAKGTGWLPTKVTLELSHAEAGAILRACELIKKGEPVQSDHGANLTISQLHDSLLKMFTSPNEG
jgi:hypothetical protein